MPGFTINGVGGPGNPVPNKGDWLRTHRFRLMSFFNITPESNTDFIAVKDITLPDKKIKKLGVQTIGTEYAFAKSASYTPLKINFYGSSNLLTAVEALHDKPHSLELGIGDFDDYKKEVTIGIHTQSDPYEDGINLVEYKFKGAWISDVTHGQVSYGSTDIKDIGVTIEFDFFEIRSDGKAFSSKTNRADASKFAPDND